MALKEDVKRIHMIKRDPRVDVLPEMVFLLRKHIDNELFLSIGLKIANQLFEDHGKRMAILLINFEMHLFIANSFKKHLESRGAAAKALGCMAYCMHYVSHVCAPAFNKLDVIQALLEALETHRIDSAVQTRCFQILTMFAKSAGPTLISILKEDNFKILRHIMTALHTHHTSLSVVSKAHKCLGWVAQCCDDSETRAKFSAQVMIANVIPDIVISLKNFPYSTAVQSSCCHALQGIINAGNRNMIKIMHKCKALEALVQCLERNAQKPFVVATACNAIGYALLSLQSHKKCVSSKGLDMLWNREALEILVLCAQKHDAGKKTLADVVLAAGQPHDAAPENFALQTEVFRALGLVCYTFDTEVTPTAPFTPMGWLVSGGALKRALQILRNACQRETNRRSEEAASTALKKRTKAKPTKLKAATNANAGDAHTLSAAHEIVYFVHWLVFRDGRRAAITAIRLEGFSTIVDAMVLWPEEEAFLARCCDTLGWIAHHSSPAVIFPLAEKSLPVIAGILSAFKNSAQIHASAFHALSWVASSGCKMMGGDPVSTAARKGILILYIDSLDSHPPLINLVTRGMRQHDDDVAVQAAGCATIGWIMSASSPASVVTSLTYKAKSVDAVLAAGDTHSEEVDVSKEVCFAIRWMATNGDSYMRTALASGGGPAVLVDAMVAHRRTNAVLWQAASAIHSIVECSHAGVVALQEANAADALNEYLKDAEDNAMLSEDDAKQYAQPALDALGAFDD